MRLKFVSNSELYEDKKDFSWQIKGYSETGISMRLKF